MFEHAHVRRVVVVSLLAIGSAFVLQRLLQPASFGERGHYRADSLMQVMRQEPVHLGRSACAECHPTIHAVHAKDVHRGVQCEDCHGAGREHVAFHRGEPDITPAQAVLTKEYTLEGCLFCHRQLEARPSAFAQVDPREHYELVHVSDPETPCIACHSPHEPIFLLESVSEARVHPVISECVDCHEATPETNHKSVPDHPTIFVCRDCHPSVVRDFEKREHAFLRCTACHLYRQEDEISGRVFRTGNREFCLLCHEQKPFKDAAMPQIVVAEHLEAMAPVMRRRVEDLRDDRTSCLHCHFDYVHDPELIQRLQEQER